MKITKSYLKKIISETIDEVANSDEFSKKIDDLKRKKNLAQIVVSKLQVQIKQTELDKAQQSREEAETNLDTISSKGGDTTEADKSVMSAKETESAARKALSGANDALNATRKGGSAT